MAQAKGSGTPAPDPLLQGGPGGEVPPERTPADATGTQRSAERPPTVPIKIGGKEYVVDQDIAQGLEEREQEFNRRLGEQSRELGELRQWRQRVEGTVSPAKEPEPDFDTQFFTSPSRALGVFKQQLFTEINSAYQAEQALQGFWQGFFRANPDLTEDGLLVQGILQAHPEIAQLSLSKAADELASLTRKEILRLSRKSRDAGEGTISPTGRAIVESGRQTRRSPVAPAEEEGPATLTELLKARARARHQGRTRAEPGG